MMDTPEKRKDACNGFFKIMLDDFSDVLIIPPKFVMSVIGEQDWKAVKLRSSLGKIWTVEVEEDDDGYRYFRNGWKDFVQGHELRFGYLLLFSYSGNMGFFVRVFDQTACMIRYGDFIKNGKHFNDDDDAAEEELNIQEKYKDCQREVTYMDRTEEEHVIHRQSQTKNKPQVDFSGKPKFRVTMRAYNLSKTSMHVIPTSFLDSNDLTCIRKAILSNSAGNWTMNVHHRLQKNRKLNVFGHGWLTFFKENKLKAGDVCIFELISVTKSEAHFFVTREQDLIRTTNISFKSKEGEDQEIECLPGQSTSRCPTIKRPHLAIVIKKCHLSCGYLHIPTSFSALNYLSNQPDVTLMDTDGKSWKIVVHLSCLNNKKYPRLGTGWSKFCHDKKVAIGDICTFELISNGKKAKMIFDVQKKKKPQQRFKAKNKETSVDTTGGKSVDDIIDVETYEQQNDVRSKKRIEQQLRCSRYPKRQKVAQAKSSSTDQHILCESSEKTQFVVTLKWHNFLRGYGSQLNVPRNFNGWKFFSGNCKVKLVNAKGKSWLVNIYRCRERVKFGAGWYLFACDNGLKEGDLCRFTLICEREAVMRLDVLGKETKK